MSVEMLVMKYHPAKKEVEFKRFQNGEETKVSSKSKLQKYMSLKGTFVLQNYGNEFFDDIVYTFSGVKKVDIGVVTTKQDYEDFEQMVEYYNEHSSVVISTTLLTELPDMEQTFQDVKKCGLDSVGVLDESRNYLRSITYSNKNVEDCAEEFAKLILNETNNIKDKIDKLNDTTVNLCFTGVYSSGKSALINAILGYKILPENIKSETAKMVRISSPSDGIIKVEFRLLEHKCLLAWNEVEKGFEFIVAPTECEERADIQSIINSVKEECLSENDQLRKVLEKLNVSNVVSTEITLYYPISLDNEQVRFTIYDTPGTDSDVDEHKRVLDSALKDQQQSILIYVIKPDALEGEGNSTLLNKLKEAEKKSSKTSIDIGRSLFVINKADTIEHDEMETLQFGELKDKVDDTATIKLQDKKLFFASARYAYAAKAVQNGVATSDDEKRCKAGLKTLADEDGLSSFCYRKNRVATSEVATRAMIKACDEAYEQSANAGDDAERLVVASGLYALEREISQFGMKYASAVRAYAIIDSIERALGMLSTRAHSIKNSNADEIAKKDSEILELRKTIEDTIKKAYDKYDISKGLPIETQKELKTDSASKQRFINEEIVNVIRGILKHKLFSKKVMVRDSDANEIKNAINRKMEGYTSDYKDGRKRILEKTRGDFIEDVKKAITDNGAISEEAKAYVLQIPPTELPPIKKITGINQAYDDAIVDKGKKILFFKREYLDDEEFISSIKGNVNDLIDDLIDDYVDDFSSALNDVLGTIKKQFEDNLGSYSISMKGLVEDREAMIKLGDNINDLAQRLQERQDELNSTIWKEYTINGDR